MSDEDPAIRPVAHRICQFANGSCECGKERRRKLCQNAQDLAESVARIVRQNPERRDA
ncbi:MAG TPA: hypothetical protein VIM56_06270 [Rhizomicrobium sp.]